MTYSIRYSEIPAEDGVQFIDVRAPVEFAQGHIPGAVNIPLFVDNERAEIGTMYKKVGKNQALQLGEKIARPKVDAILAQIQSYLPAELVIYCWRGGKRSTEVCRLVNESGTSVRRIQGGYKEYRRHIRHFIEQPRKIVMIGGKTGSGKTDLLLGIKEEGEQVIDLEGLAHHKGSVFGHINEDAQPSTEQFENDFFEELRATNPEKLLLLENESYVIGSVHLPPPLLLQMRAAPLLIVDIPLEARVDRLVREYTSTDRQELIEACQRIAQKLTQPKLQEVTAFIENDDFASACKILLEYYDHYYNRGLDKRKSQEISYLSLNGFNLDADVDALITILANFDNEPRDSTL